MTPREAARDAMLTEVRTHIPSIGSAWLPDMVLFEIWSTVVVAKELWYHAQPHHHRELSVRINNGKKELFDL